MDLGSGKKLFPIPDPEVKKAPDPGSATLICVGWGLNNLLALAPRSHNPLMERSNTPS